MSVLSIITLLSHKLGDPEPDVTWLRNGKEVKVKKKDKRIKIDWDMKTDEYTLEIQNASKDDIGEYTAVAKNEKGTVTVVITVTFKIKKEVKKEEKKEEQQKEIVEESIEVEEAAPAESKAPTVVQEDVTAEETKKVEEKPKDDNKKEVEGKPSFVKQPENIQIEEGETIRLVCQVKGMITIIFSFST